MESPPGCCKIIHWVRHAEGVHNVESRKNHDFLMSSSLFDSQLSPLGCQQVRDLRNHVRSSELLQKIDLVITSPLLRTMQTAVVAFGGDIISDASSHIQQKGSILMVANTGGTELPSVSSCSCPPFLAVELCRERLGVHPCDSRRSVTQYKSMFPAIDFSEIESDNDIQWKPDYRETPEEIAARGVKFINWLRTRPEKAIAIVTHSVILQHILNTFAAPSSDGSNFLNNCELRSMMLVEKKKNTSEENHTDGQDMQLVRFTTNV